MANDPIPRLPVAVATITFVGVSVVAFLRFRATHPEISLFLTSMFAGGIGLTAALVVGFFVGAAGYFLKAAYKHVQGWSIK